MNPYSLRKTTETKESTIYHGINHSSQLLVCKHNYRLRVVRRSKKQMLKIVSSPFISVWTPSTLKLMESLLLTLRT